MKKSSMKAFIFTPDVVSWRWRIHHELSVFCASLSLLCALANARCGTRHRLSACVGADSGTKVRSDSRMELPQCAQDLQQVGERRVAGGCTSLAHGTSHTSRLFRFRVRAHGDELDAIKFYSAPNDDSRSIFLRSLRTQVHGRSLPG